MLSHLVLGLAAASTAAALPRFSGVAARDGSSCCTTTSLEGFAWTVSDFSYNTSIVFSTPAHQIDSGVVSFGLRNPAINYTASCEAYSTQLSDFFYGNIVYNCTESSTGAATKFTFNKPASELNFNQTWTCPDPEYPTSFACSGAVELSLECTSSSYTNPNWSIGQIYSSNETTCTQGDGKDFTVAPTQCTAVA